MLLAKRKKPQRSGRAKSPTPDLLENVLVSLEDAVILTDLDDRITLFNQAAQLLTGLPEAQVLGRRCADVFESTPILGAMVERTRALRQSQSCGEESLAVGRRQVPVRIGCSPIWGPKGLVHGAALVVQDLSYQKKLEDEARRNETLARLGSLVAGLAHEVKNPLGGIKGAAQLLERRFAEEPEVAAYTGVMIREVDRLSQLVEQLLTLGAPRPPQFVALNVHKVIREVLALMATELSGKRIAVRLEIDPSLPGVRGDEAQLTHVFLNLVKNALEAMPDGGTVTIVTRLETDFHILRAAQAAPSAGADAATHLGKFARVELADSGPGFPADVVEHVFEPFFTTKARGTGLGLAICERIVAAHGGDIRVENRHGDGAVVTVTLPLAVP